MIPLLLIKMDIRRIIKETGRMFGAFHLAAIGTVLGSIVAIVFLSAKVPYLELITPAMTGSYIGGAVNFVALVSIFDPPSDLVNATIVADNGVMVVYFIFLIALPGFAIMEPSILPTSAHSATSSLCCSSLIYSQSFEKSRQVSVSLFSPSQSVSLLTKWAS